MIELLTMEVKFRKGEARDTRGRKAAQAQDGAAEAQLADRPAASSRRGERLRAFDPLGDRKRPRATATSGRTEAAARFLDPAPGGEYRRETGLLDEKQKEIGRERRRRWEAIRGHKRREGRQGPS